MSRKIIIVLIAAILVIAGVALFTVLTGRIMLLFSQNGLPALAQTEEAHSGDTDRMPAGTDAGIQTDERTTYKPDAFETVGSTESVDNDSSVRSVYTVIVDPGHGFTDEGCSSDLTGDFTEKELTLTMAEELRSILEGYGVNVIMLHDGKSFPSLTELTAFADYYDIEYNIDKCVDNNIFSAYERTIYANYLSKINAVDFFISIHVNAMENNPDYSGFEIDYCAENENSSVSKIFFDSIIDAVKSAYPFETLYTWEDSWDEAFIVTKYTSVPSVLFETGFATNAEDAARLISMTERRKLMQTVADGIMDALEAIEKVAKTGK